MSSNQLPQHKLHHLPHNRHWQMSKAVIPSHIEVSHGEQFWNHHNMVLPNVAQPTHHKHKCCSTQKSTIQIFLTVAWYKKTSRKGHTTYSKSSVPPNFIISSLLKILNNIQCNDCQINMRANMSFEVAIKEKHRHLMHIFSLWWSSLGIWWLFTNLWNHIKQDRKRETFRDEVKIYFANFDFSFANWIKIWRLRFGYIEGICGVGGPLKYSILPGEIPEPAARISDND